MSNNFDVTFPERPKYSRRDILIKGMAGALVLGGYGSRGGMVLANTPGVSHGETPGVTEGPYWVDGQVQRVDVRSNSASSAAKLAGFPIYLGLTLSQLSDAAPYTLKPLVGAKVDIWCASPGGVYSDIASEGTSGQDYLRGYQISDGHGAANFLTLLPGWYSGRTPHIHIRIRTYTTALVQTYNFASQLFFDDTFTDGIFKSVAPYNTRTGTRDTYNSTDGIYGGSSYNGSPATEAGDYLKMKLSSNGSYGVGSFHYVLDLSDSANADPTNGSETGTTGGGGSPPAGGTPPTGGTPPGR